jgi:MFS family permease
MGKLEEPDPVHTDVEAAPGQHHNHGLSLEKTASQSQGSVHSQITAQQSRISRVLSHVRTSDTLPLTPPPDGGVRAWSTACLTSLVIFNTWGFVNSFGLFQTYYVNVMHLGSNSAVSWIGSLQVFLVFGIGAFSGRALDGGYFKLVFWGGSAIYLFGMFMLSLCTTYWQVFLAHAICVGTGFGLVFVPSIALTSTYFSHAKRGMALAIAVAGSSSGGLVFPAIAEQMLPSVGFPWTVRTMAFVQMATALVCAIFMKVSAVNLIPQWCC